MKYIPDKHEHIVHVYRRDEPHGTEQALCGWRPPDTWHPKHGPVPLTALPDCERCPRCLDRKARKPDQFYALMPPEDWIKWEGAAMSEQDPSGDPGATGPRDPKAEAAAKAYAKAQRPWYKKKRWVFSGLILLIIVAAAVASGGSDDSSNTASDSGAANSAASGNEAAPKESKPESTPASSTPARSGPTDELPLQDGDWRLDSISVQDNGLGDFGGTASITYMGENPEGPDNIFTVTLFKGGKNVAALQGNASAVTPEDAVTVQLVSTDPWVSGPYKYDFQVEL